MRVLLSAHGTRGDVQPLVLLGAALRRADHEVILAAPPDAAALAHQHDVPFVECGRDVTRWIATLDLATIAFPALLRELRGMLRHELPLQARVLRELACGPGGNVDVVVTGGLQMLGRAIAEHAGAASAYVLYGPNLLPSGAHPPLFVATQRLPMNVNLLLHRATESLLDRIVLPHINRERATLGLKAHARAIEMFSRDMLLAWDGALCPAVDCARFTMHEVGALQAPPAPLGDDVEAFIATAEPCVYVGFGSMPDPNPAATRALVETAAREARVRALWVASPCAPSTELSSSEHVLVLRKGVSHVSLFPRMDAIVHHCGAGTTAAASRAGVPQIAVPHFLDQPMWALRLAERGVSAATLSRASLTSSSLARALRRCIDDGVLRARASALASTLASDAASNAVRALERIVERAEANGARWQPSEVFA